MSEMGEWDAWFARMSSVEILVPLCHSYNEVRVATTIVMEN